MLDCNSFVYEYCLNGARLIENIVVKPTCKWVCIIIFKQLYHSRTLSPSFNFKYISLKQVCKTPVKDLMRNSLFRYQEHLKLCIILCIFRVLNFFFVFTKLYILSLINSSLQPPNFANVSSMTVRHARYGSFRFFFDAYYGR